MTASSIWIQAALKCVVFSHDNVFSLTPGCSDAHGLRDYRVLLRFLVNLCTGADSHGDLDDLGLEHGPTSITCGAWLAKTTEEAIGFGHYKPASLASMPMPVRSTLGYGCCDFRHASRFTRFGLTCAGERVPQRLDLFSCTKAADFAFRQLRSFSIETIRRPRVDCEPHAFRHGPM